MLYLTDNAGETAFDRVLIETLSAPVTYAVKGSPILNDAITVDAKAAGIDSCASIIPMALRHQVQSWIFAPNPSALCIIPPHSSLLGQANYETLSMAGPRVFCLLQVKCPVIGRDLDAPVGSNIVRQSDTPTTSSMV